MSIASKSASRFAIIATFLFIAGAALASDEVSITDAPAESHHTQFTMMNSYRQTDGRFDPYGTYSSNPENSSIWSLNTSFIFNYRFEKPWEVGVSLSGREMSTDVPTGTSQGYSFGQPSAQATYHTTWHGVRVLPSLAFSTPLKFSSRQVTGDPTAYMDDSSASDGVFSAYSLRAGLSLMKHIPKTKIRAAISGNVAVPFDSRTEDGTITRRGHSYSVAEGLAYQLTRRWNTRIGIRQNWGAETLSDGIYIDGSASRYLSSNFGVGYAATERMNLSAGFETSYPFYAYEANNTYSPSASLSLSYTGL